MDAENIRLGRLVPGNPDEMIVPTRQVFAMVDELETLREKVKPVNAAAMREALESCRNFIVRIDRAFNPFMQGLLENAVAKADAALAAPPEPPLNAAALREALEDSQSLLESFSRGEYGSQVREQMRDNRAALAAPARNCDRFGGDEEKLIEACLNERGLLVTENFRDVFSDWLLAPAKGGAA